MQNFDSFSEAEKLGRQIWEKKLIINQSTDITFTEDKYNPVDVRWSKNNIEYVGEIKLRSYASTSNLIENGGVLLEKYKYDALKSIQAREGRIPYYINIFKDNVIYLFDLSNYSPIWIEEEDKFPKTTMGDNTKVTKVVTYLSLSQGIKCSYKKL